MTPEDYLRTKGLSPKPAPGEWLIRCNSCGDSTNPKHAHLYVNRDHGAWKCHRCGAKGSFAELQRSFGDEPDAATTSWVGRWQVFEAALDVCQDTLLAYPKVLKYLQTDRHLSPSTIGKYQLGYMDQSFVKDMKAKGFSITDLREAGLVGKENNYPSFNNRIVIPYMNRETIVTLRGKQIGGNMLQVEGVSLSLYGVDNVRSQDQDIYICEGEVDTMYLDQLGYPSCGVPGADTFKPEWATWFENARRVFIVLDADDAGRAGAAKIQQHLGVRAKIVELPVPEGEESTDISEYFQRDGHTTEDFDVLIESFRGRRLFTIGDAMAERDIMLTASGMALGWKALDHWIHPGILPGQVMVVLAKTGVGKTAWLTQVLHNLSEYYTYDGHYKHGSGEIDEHHRPGGPAEPVLVLSLEQTKGELVDRMQKIARFYDPRLPDELFRQAYRNVRLNDENKIPPADMRPLVAEFIEDVEMPPKLIVLDYLGYWARSFKGKSRYEQVSDAIMELKSIAKEYGVSIVVPHQVSRSGRKGERLELDFARDSGVVEETADFALALYAPHTKEDREDATTSIDSRSDVRLEILKSRHGGVGREQRMSWAPASLALPETGDPYIRRLIEFEYQWMDEGLLYSDILAKLKGTKI